MHFLVGNNGATEALTILNSGNVGIGTTAPTVPLEVAGTGNTVFGDKTGSSIRIARDDDTVPRYISWYNSSNTRLAYLGGTSSTNLHFALENSANLEIIGGNVGIGTTGPTAVLHLKAGTATASTAPLKFTSGTLLTTAEAGAVEFLTDAFYGTITTGAARKTFAFLESPSFTTPALGAATGTGLVLTSANTTQVTTASGLVLSGD